MTDYRPRSHIVLVANGEPPTSNLLYKILKPHVSLIAVDGGFKTCHAYQRIPELVLGDFDSVDEKLLNNYPTMKVMHTPDQNKTDLEKAFDYLSQFPIEQIIVLGALGRQIDHTYKNLELLTHHPIKVIYQTPYEQLFSLEKRSTFSCSKGIKLSLIPFGNKVGKVKTHGLKWELKGEDLKEMSISNVAMKETISTEFETGHLLCALNYSAF